MQKQSSSTGSASQVQSLGPIPKLPNYETGGFFDELVDVNNLARPDAEELVSLFNRLPPKELLRRQHAIEQSLYRMGITFTVYSDKTGTEKIMPFDVVPRIVSAMLWKHIDAGLKQRIRALNRFLCDIYNEREIVQAGIIPADLIDSAPAYLKECRGLKPFNDVWCHITGTDLVRDDSGTVYVLEDNLRCPSGVSYVLQNRHVMKRNFPQVFSASRVRPVNDYSSRLFQLLCDVAPPHVSDPTVVVLTPGVFNSAYYEHSYLAQRMGVELVEGRDLVVEGDMVYMRTTGGLQRVDVIYRRIDDAFLDPKTFRKDSVLGVSGLMDAYRAGNVTLANAPGTGIADDKVIYAFVPDMIRFYLDEEPILPNVPTYVCQLEEDRQYVLDHMDELVIKAAGESGGYGILIGTQSTKAERDEFAKKIIEDPRNWIAQPTLKLSRSPTMVDDHLEGRHVDLRPYILCSRPDDVWVLPGGLTRVALRKGSLVVNSSQGGGSKDTWVVAEQGQRVASSKDGATEPLDS
ncbi:circularly permuted type 2 ATP-grasp protein [Stieleria sp. TO1_6]|uniref:circularly permuted type 2 ATP-grasp protein n=1 Tax=Stieleria tagensis TaxID=2956795 RepID=UPI00209A8D7E|nr:circularly permuted type 2 ATP-grasp protein [Stieleria tagensis]MCO8120293.1 circularly permuted type 2 ATP-grasp protein [Stieleria tagensis]